MEVRHWLAGVAAITLAGSIPAAAQAPRSLFEAAPAPASPVTMGFEGTAPAKPATPAASSAAAAKLPEPKQADAKPASVKPMEAKSSGALAAPSAPSEAARGDKTRAASEAATSRRGERRLASRSEPTQLPTLVTTAPPAVMPGAQPTAAVPAAAARPTTRAEQRRAAREARRQAAAGAAAASVAPQPATPTGLPSLFGIQTQPSTAAPSGLAGRSQIDALVSHHARLNNVPESLVHRVIVRESKYNPRAVGRGGAMGLMQIKTATARGVGYTGGPAGLLDAETNLTYGIKYLAGAWRVSGGSHDRAVSHYASGYYYAAKRAGHIGRRGRHAEPQTTASVPAQAPSLFSLFSVPAR